MRSVLPQVLPEISMGREKSEECQDNETLFKNAEKHVTGPPGAGFASDDIELLSDGRSTLVVAGENIVPFCSLQNYWLMVGSRQGLINVHVWGYSCSLAPKDLLRN